MSSRVCTQHLLKGVPRKSSSKLVLPQLATQTRRFATPVPPVTQDAAGSKGPTAMVFLNMGGPSKTDEVGDFLSRLFVCPFPIPTARRLHQQR
jgi:ferrochelatase